MIFSFMILFSSLARANAATLKLEDYLSQVREKNSAITGSVDSAEGSKLRAREGEGVLSPFFFGSAAWNVDQSPKTNPPVQGTKTQYDSYSFGFSKLWSFGLSSKLSFNTDYTEISGASPTFVPMAKYYDGRPMLELSFPLWRNGFGSETRAQIQAAEAQALAASAGERYGQRLLLAQAESTYWRLALARDVLRVEKDSLARSVRIRDWNARRVKLRLADASDLFQAEAILRLRQIELQAAEDEHRAASEAFNSMRGDLADSVSDAVESLYEMKAAPEIKKQGLRADVEAALQSTRALEAASQAGIEKGRPNVDVFGTYAWNGLSDAQGTAISNSLKSDHPSSSVGVKVNVPLDFGLISDVKSGYAREIAGADAKYQRKLFEEKEAWDDLMKKYAESKRRLELTREVETVQKQKFQHEQERHKSGKSTAFLVLQFEQDLAAAEVARLRSEAEVLGVLAQIRTFEP